MILPQTIKSLSGSIENGVKEQAVGRSGAGKEKRRARVRNSRDLGEREIREWST